LDAKDQVDKFKEFFELNYQDDLLTAVSKSEEFIVVDFSKLAKYDPDLADSFLENPEDVTKAAEYAISRFDLGVDDVKINVRFNNLPASSYLLIRDIRSKHLNKVFEFKGLVRQKSDVRPQVTSAKFECPSCGNIIPILQLDQKFKEPSVCNVCGRKGKFTLLNKELVDAQKIVLEEDPEDMEGAEQPKRINVFLKNDLVSPMSNKKTNPGSKIRVIGIIKEVPMVLQTGGKSTRYDLMVEANYVDPLNEEFTSLKISPKKKEKILELSKDPLIYEKFVTSIAPTIYGHERIKEALLLQMFGGQKKTQDDGVQRRGDIHVLLIGDPGSGKCLSGETKIQLQSGRILRIKELAEKREFRNEWSTISENVSSLYLDGEMSKSTASKVWKRRTQEKLIKIILRSGKEIICTKNHPLFTTNSGIIYAKEAKDFSKGEYIATPRRLNIQGSLQTIRKTICSKVSNNSKTYKYPEILTKELARLLGYLVGDGYLKQRKTARCVGFTNNNKEVIDDYNNLMRILFGAINSKRTKNSTTEIFVSSQGIFNYFKDNFLEIFRKAPYKDVPVLIQKSKLNITAEFVKSLFECDSHVNTNKRQIEYSSISKDLAENVQHLLIRHGVHSFLKKKNKYATNTKNKRRILSYEVIISGEFLKDYASEIGYVSSQKKNKLLSILNFNNNTNTDLIPNLKPLLLDIRKKFGLAQNEMGIVKSSYAHYEQENRLPSRKSIQKIANHLYRKGFYSIEVKILINIAAADVFWDSVISIEEVASEEFVYDLEVNTTHNFVANGVVVHNSQLLKRISHVAPKSRFVSGKGASGAGLTAAVVRDEFIRGWALEAGALVLANKGMVCIDELDKMSKDDTSAMHEALEQQTINVSKANIQATLKSETTVLAAANPKFGRFDPYDVLVKQIDLPPTLINRFDLIFPVKDLPNREKDEKLASFILKLHKEEIGIKVALDTEMIKLYVAYAKQTCHPKLTDPALKEIQEYFVNMRNSGSGEDKIKSIPISARQLEGLVRLSEASAKTRLSKTVTKKDAKRAIDLLHHCLTLIGLDTETGKFDIDRIATGITASQRGSMHTIKGIIIELEKALSSKIIPIDDVVREAEIKGISESKTEEIIDGLKRKGDLFSPKPGHISRM